MIIKGGALLDWESNNDLIGSTRIDDTFNPSFDFSQNDGTAITIFVNGDLRSLTNIRLVSNDITQIHFPESNNVNALLNLKNLFLTGINLSLINISAARSLSMLLLARNSISSLNISYNPLLSDLRINNNRLSSTSLDCITT